MKNKIALALVAFACTLSVAGTAQAKGNHAEYKKECLASDPSLKGKALKSCIKEKRAAAKAGTAAPAAPVAAPAGK